MCVYFIQNKFTKNIKIGISKDPYKRMRQLQTASGDPLEMLLFINTDGNDKMMERDLHDFFSDTRCIGEWFSPSKEIMAFIEGYRICLSNKEINKNNMEFNFKEEKKSECTGIIVSVSDYIIKLLLIVANEKNTCITEIIYLMLKCAIEVYFKTTNREDIFLTASEY